MRDYLSRRDKGEKLKSPDVITLTPEQSRQLTRGIYKATKASIEEIRYNGLAERLLMDSLSVTR